MKHFLQIAATVSALALISCEYDVPITASPTRRVDARLLGDWTLVTGQWMLVTQPKAERMKIRRFDDSNYVVSYEDLLFRAHHSDIAGLPLVSAQEIQDEQRTYIYFAWRLSDDGKRLTLEKVNADVIPKGTTDSATVDKLIETNRQNPALFDASFEYARDVKQP